MTILRPFVHANYYYSRCLLAHEFDSSTLTVFYVDLEKKEKKYLPEINLRVDDTWNVKCRANEGARTGANSFDRKKMDKGREESIS